jgi:hypothetical protein
MHFAKAAVNRGPADRVRPCGSDRRRVQVVAGTTFGQSFLNAPIIQRENAVSEFVVCLRV